MKNISPMVLIVSCLYSICSANYDVSGVITDYITESPIESSYVKLTGLSPNSESDSVYSRRGYWAHALCV
jgi:hypothetical protein